MTEKGFKKLKPAKEGNVVLLPWDEARAAVAGTKFESNDTIAGISSFTWEKISRDNTVADISAEERINSKKEGYIVVHSFGFDWFIPQCCIANKDKKKSSDAAIDKLAEGIFGKPLKETAKERVQKELAELEDRTEKLSHALAPLADKIGTETEAYSLLNLQLGVMRTYATILRRRLAIWKD